VNQKDILTLYDYNAWANARVLDVAAGLSAEQFLRDLKNSFPSVRDTLAHILGAEWIWMRRWRGEPASTLLQASDFPTVQSLRDRFVAVERERRGFLEALGEINGRGISSVIVAYDPSRIILDGSVALQNEDLILPFLIPWVDRFLPLPEIRLTGLEGLGPLYGASVIARGYDTVVGPVLPG
jgi:hypothetical protein